MSTVCNDPWSSCYGLSRFSNPETMARYGAVASKLSDRPTALFVRQNDPAMWSPYNQYIVVPYLTNTLATTTPAGPIAAAEVPPVALTQQGAAAMDAAVQRTATRQQNLTVENKMYSFYNTTQCGCCKTAYWPVTPHSAIAMSEVIYRNQLPYQSLSMGYCSQSP